MQPTRMLLLIVCCLAIVGCSSTVTQNALPTSTATVPAKSTTEPSPTFTPSATSMPTATPTLTGGGGKLLFFAYKSVFKGIAARAAGNFDVYSANLDGNNLTPLTQGPDGISNILAGASPDGKQVLYYSTTHRFDRLFEDDNRVDLWVTGIQSSKTVQMNSGQVHSYLAGATWAPDGSVYFVGWDGEGLGLFHVRPEGSDLGRVAKPVSLAASGKAEILFFDSQNRGVYWVTGGYCTTNGLCSARYYWTALDGSDQKQVWKWINGARDRLSLSPDGKWIAYELYVGSSIEDSAKNGCYVATADGSQIRRLPGNHPSCLIRLHQSDFWSPDSQAIIYWTNDEDKRNYPVHEYLPTQNTVTDLPDLQTSACEEFHWLPDGSRILFTDCRSNYMGYDQPTSMRLLDLASNQLTVYPGTDYCEPTLSPDKLQAFLYNCHSEGVGEVSFRYYILDLETANLTPLFTDVLNASQPSADWTLFVPAPWEGWSH
jgi:Tol biopolymer transport system component